MSIKKFQVLGTMIGAMGIGFNIEPVFPRTSAEERKRSVKYSVFAGAV